MCDFKTFLHAYTYQNNKLGEYGLGLFFSSF